MNRIKSLREQNGLTQTDLAKKIGVTQATISGWEKGKVNIPIDSLLVLSEILEASTDDILGIENKTLSLVNNDPSLTNYLEDLKNRPEMKMLFSLARSATKEDVKKAVKIIEMLLDKQE